MKKNLLVILVLAVAVCFAGFVASAQPLQKAQQRLLAKRAAQVDAYRNLSELVNGLQIDSQTYVRDFVAESDYVRTSFENFIKGAHIIGMPRYLSDGSCEVDVEMTIDEIVNGLTEIAKHTTFGHKYVFQQITRYVQEKVIKATGSGVPREEGLSVALPVVEQTAVNVPGWENVTARGRLMAQRAALLDAYRNMAERVKGIKITGNTYVRDFVAESDYVQTALNTFIKGTRIVGGYRYLPDGEVEVTIEVAVRRLVKELTSIQQHLVQRGWNWRSDTFKTVNFEQIITVMPLKVIQSTGNGVVPLRYRREGAVKFTPVSASVPLWADKTVSAVGRGVAPEGKIGADAKIMAVRAAELDARRHLLEKVYGVHINANTTVRDYVARNDIVRSDVDVFITGSTVSEPRYLNDGSVEVTASIPLKDLAKIVRE